MKVEIIVVYVARYERGHEKNFVPPLTGIHLAALTPGEHEVHVTHQQTDAVPYESDADLVALSFFSGFAREAYRIAGEFRRRGKRVVAGGPHVSFWPEEALEHVDAVVTGEAESAWPRLLEDAARGRLERVYRGEAQPLAGIPTPRYDLLPRGFFVPRVIQATRGCPYTCSFCTVPALNPGFRVRPVEEVLRDVAYDDFPWWWQRKIVWFWDDNLTANRRYVKTLLTGMVPLKKWWLTQASIDITQDVELLDLMEASGCIGIFLGIESFNPESLADAHKRQNRVAYYRERIEVLHRRGIAVMAGFIAGFDHDTPETIVAMAHNLQDAGIDVPFLSVLTPFKGTPLYDQMEREGRLLAGRSWDFTNGYNVAFEPRDMSPDALYAAHRELWRRSFAPAASLARIARGVGRLRIGAALMSAAMNGFYGLKAWRGNEPVDMRQRFHRAVADQPSRMTSPGPTVHSASDPLTPSRQVRLPGASPVTSTQPSWMP